jgi:hypothetical protein
MLYLSNKVFFFNLSYKVLNNILKSKTKLIKSIKFIKSSLYLKCLVTLIK